MENTETFKVRLREKVTAKIPEKDWRYALTISQDGVILSSTKDATKAGTFSAQVIQAVSIKKANPTGVYSKTDVEWF
jgi:hypothetical protein